MRDKKFQRLTSPSKRVHFNKITVEEVLIELRRGSLSSLDSYLAQEGGISDRRIAVELRKLISGTQHRSKYRIITIHHPDSPHGGGRPSKTADQLTEKERQAVALYEEKLAMGDPTYIAIENTAIALDVSESTIKRTIRKSKKLKKKQDDTDLVLNRRAETLQNLKALNEDIP